MLEFDLSFCPERIPDMKELMTRLYNASSAYQHAKAAYGTDPASTRELMQLHSLICLIYYTPVKYFSRPKEQPFYSRPSPQKTTLRDVIQYISPLFGASDADADCSPV